MASDVTRLIGIDFGTSTSVVCVKRYKDGEPIGGAFQSSAVTFGDGQGDTRAYTVARLNADGSYTCGRPAEDADPEAQIFREFKMDLESLDKAKSAQAKALTEEFFKYLYRWYDHQRSNLGEAGDQEKTVVSFPAKWSEGTRAFMVETAKKAGFPNVSAMDEPSAALYATLTQNMNDVSAKGLLRAGEPGYMLLVDMGAGTTDLAVCRYTVDAGAGGFIRAEQIKNEIVSTWPEAAGAPTFGGREVDRLLEDYLTDYMTSCGLDPAMARQLVCGTASVKPWKETVVSPRLNEGNLVDSCGFLSGYMMLLPKKQPFPSIDRNKLEELLHDKLEDFKSLVTGCLDKAAEIEPAIAENGVDLVVLTGGHSAWYFTEALLNGTIPGIAHPALKRAQTEKSRVLRLSNPQETVALGLVYSLLPLQMPRTPKKTAKYMLLLDMGARTTDLTVRRYIAGAGDGQTKCEAVCTWPESAGGPTFGGADVDRLLEGYLTDYMTSCGLDPAMARKFVCGTDSVKPWKETVVSPRLNEGNPVDNCGFLSGYMMLLPKKQPFPTIDRAKLVELLKDKLDDFKSLVAGCLDKASAIEPAIAENGVDLVVLTGGNSVWYFTEDLINGALPGLTHPALKRAQKEKSRVLRLGKIAPNDLDSLLLSKMEREADTAAHHREAIQQLTDTIKKVEETKRESPDDAPPTGKADQADRYFQNWVRTNAQALFGWTVASPVVRTIRWTYSPTRDYSVTATEEGMVLENKNRETEWFRKEVSWTDFLSGSLRRNGFHVESQREGRADELLAAIADGAMLNQLLRFFQGLQKELQGEASPGGQEPRKQANVTYVWDDSLLEKAKRFIQENRKPWPMLFQVPERTPLFRARLNIPPEAEIYLAHTSALLRMNLGKDGWAITNRGIYARSTDPVFVSWQTFLNNVLYKNATLYLKDSHGVTLANLTTYSLNGIKITEAREVDDLIIRLQAYLQKESLALRGGN